MKILQADLSDIEELAKVEMESKKCSFPDLMQPFELDMTSRIDRWQTYFMGSTPGTSKPPRITLKAINDHSEIVGYLSGHLSARFDLDAEIQSFYILYQYQNKGIGTRLLTEFVYWLIKQEGKSLCVGIHPKNKYQSFYLKHGGKYLNEHWIFWKEVSLIITPCIY